MDEKQCRCPVRPYFGGWGSGSAQESEALNAWQHEHGAHPYAKARDTLAHALQAAETDVDSGAAVLDMVADVFCLSRRKFPDETVAEHGRNV